MQATRKFLPLWPALAVSAALLAGCAATSGGPSSAGASGGRGAALALPTIDSEQRRLGALFSGTPVVIEKIGADRLRMQVPLHFCFDAGRSTVKPPLAALLERVASSVRLQPAFNVQVAASGDRPGSKATQLSRERAAAARDYMIARGAPRARFVPLGASIDDGIELIVSDDAQ